MSNDLELKLVLRATDQGLTGTVRIAAKEAGNLSAALDKSKQSADKTGKGQKNLQGELNKTGTASKKGAKGLNELDRAAKKTSNSSGFLEKKVRSLGGALVAYLSVRKVYESVEAWTTLNNRLKLVTSDTEGFVSAQENVFNIAQQTRQPLTATAELYQRIAINQKELSLTGQQVADITETISQTMVISGTSATSAKAAMVQLGQAFASGTLRGEELNSVLEQAPALSQAIAAGLGVSIGALREMGAAGELTAKQVIGALRSQASAVEDQFNLMTPTIGQSMTTVSNSITKMIGVIDTASKSSKTLASGIGFISLEIDIFTQKIVDLDEAVYEPLDRIQKLFYALQVPGKIIAKGGLGFGGLDVIKEVLEEFEAITTEIDMLANGRAIERYFKQWENLEIPLEDLRRGYKAAGVALEDLIDTTDLFGFSQESATKATKESEKAARDAAKAHEQYLNTLQGIKDRTDPAAASVRRLKQEYELLIKAIGLGDASQSGLHGWIDANVMIESTTRKISDSLDDAAGEATVWETITENAVESVDDSFRELFRSGLDGWDDFWDQMVDTAKDMLAELAYTLAKEKLWVNIGANVTGQGSGGYGRASTGGSDITSLSSLSSLTSISNFLSGAGSLAVTGVSSVGGAFGSGVSGHFATLGNSSLNLLGGLGDAAFEEAVLQGGLEQGTNLQAGVGMLANALYGYAGAWAGDAVGQAIFDKEAESSYGATAGAAIGTYILPGWGTLIGAFFGSLADVIGGGDGKERYAVGVNTDPTIRLAANANRQYGESGLAFTTYQKRTGQEGWDVANVLQAQFLALDATLVGLSDTLFGVSNIDLTGVTLDNKNQQAGKDGGGFYGSAIFNGVSEADLQGASREFIIDWTAAVNEATGSNLDFLPLLELAADTENAGDALIRLHGQFLAVNSIFELTGITLYEASVTGIAAADNLLVAFGGVENLSAGMTQFYNLFYTQEEKLDAVREQMLSTFDALGVAMPTSRDQFKELVLGIDNTTESGAALFANLIAISPTFYEISTAVESLSDTASASIDVLNSASKSAYSILLDAVKSEREILTSSYEDGLDELQNAQSGITDNLSDLRDDVDVAMAGLERWAEQENSTLQTAHDTRIAGLQAERASLSILANERLAAINTERSAIAEAYQTTLISLRDSLAPVNDQIRELGAVTGAFDNALGSLRLDSLAFDRQSRSQAQGVLSNALGGNLPGLDVLQGALGEVARPSIQFFSSFADYAYDQAVTRATVSSLLAEADAQLTVEEQTLESLENQITNAEEQHSANLAKLDDMTAGVNDGFAVIDAQLALANEQQTKALEAIDDQIRLAKVQIAALDGVDTNIYTLTDVTRAIATYEQAAELSAGQVAAIGEQIAEEKANFTAEMQRLDTTLELAEDQLEALALLDNSVLSVVAAVRTLDNTILAVAEAQGIDISTIPGFASGGGFGGGLRVVGERGPEIEVTGASHIVSNADIPSLFNLSPLLEENRALRRELTLQREDSRIQNFNIAKELKDMALRLKKFDKDGMPEVRTA